MALVNNLSVDSKYNTKAGDRTLTTQDETATHATDVQLTINISENDAPGTVKLLLPIDTDIDPIVQEMAKGYEQWTIDEMDVTLNSSSPLGDTSGSAQSGLFRDPANATFGDDKAVAKRKAIRQSGSVNVLPRSGHRQNIKFNSIKYTKRSSDSRFHTLAVYYIVVHTAPSMGDNFVLQLLLTFTVKFIRRTLIIDTTSALNITKMAVMFETPVLKSGQFFVTLPPIPQHQASVLKLQHPVLVSVTKEKRNHILKIKEIKLKLVDYKKGLYVVVFNHNAPDKVKFLESAPMFATWEFLPIDFNVQDKL